MNQEAGGPPVSLVVSNSDLAVGENRVSFGLVDRDYMPVRPEKVSVRAVFYEPGAATGQVRHSTTGRYESCPPREGGAFSSPISRSTRRERGR